MSTMLGWAIRRGARVGALWWLRGRISATFTVFSKVQVRRVVRVLVRVGSAGRAGRGQVGRG